MNRYKLAQEARRAARERYWSVYDRDEAECAVCGSGGRIEIHHRDGDWLNNHMLNLIAICKRCHRREHRQRQALNRLESWKSDFESIGDASVGRNTVYTDGGRRD